MADKQLSQAQIDALLGRLNSGEEEDQEEQIPIKKYDFRSPKKFTKEQLRTLDGLHENFSRVLSSHFSGLLRSYCEITVLSIEEQRYFEYNYALPDTALIGMISFRPTDKRYSEGILLMDLSTSLGYFMIDRLLGGPGTGYGLTRGYTDMEIAILENVFAKIVVRLQEAWNNYIDVSFSLSSIETNARLLQALAPEDIVVIVMLDVKIMGLNGTLNICVPAENLEEMIDKFSIRYAKSSKRQALEDVESRKKLIFSELLDTDLTVTALLDQSQLTLRDVLQLQVDDVIPLAKSIGGDITIKIDDIPWYSAKLGEVKMKKAVRLNEMLN